ncbi:ribonuclease HII [Hoeflea sp. YIM 152468]|uniref:ribonuclease HII n=1 Tax=Hoeflea sp. YIM 152468 TaxID=3031759 RepID=UPI0023DA3367|nr:ribonuclease HII [Hoeflea sp. YIM 152468]MDF1606627.1 ribonuclease HII [Hoeflea sp. YIM 152468]
MARTPPDSLFPDYPAMPDCRFETHLVQTGFPLVAGLDEAGRGPLAGPVVAAAVIIDLACLPEGLNDSKAVKPAMREQLFEAILASCLVAVGSASAREIEATNIRAASLTAMRRALSALAVRADYALVDGRDLPPGLSCPGRALIKGDARSLSIAAASIIAKVTRDRMMTRAAHIYPAYGFEQHMGYGAPRHLRAIAEHGPCPLHRMTFRPLRQD